MNQGTPVVIVEDDDAHRDLIAHLLAFVAPESRVLLLAAEDRETIADRAPFGALVLLDRRLGAHDSIALVGPLVRHRADLSVAIMSAFVTPEDRLACLAAGAGTVFEKPGDLNGWRSTLLGLLGGGGRTLARAA